ncbi:MAG TPA: PaaX family transcriptional regulator C-terminal domain-containing protein, partial [Acidimicrobiales bacterium]
SSTVDGAAALAAELWDLEAWTMRAIELDTAVGRLVPQLEAGDSTALAPGFVLSAAVLRHLQADPLLPEELCPDSWTGSELRTHYDRYDIAYRSTLAGWHRAHAGVGQ